MNKKENYEHLTIRSYTKRDESPEVLFWVGCAGAYDERYKKVSRAFAKILTATKIKFAVLGDEERCTGDPARRAGNEFLFQKQALGNIAMLNSYKVKDIITTCPHCFNTLSEEYTDYGGYYNVMHHTEFLQKLIDEGRVRIKEGNSMKNETITYHDSCYLGRANGIYEAPREALESLKADLVEMKHSRASGLCCGAGGAQMFKDAEKGTKAINIERTKEAVATGATTIATACPFCMIMLSDGLKEQEGEHKEVKVKDLAELIAEAQEPND